jgi:hypothetical protein
MGSEILHADCIEAMRELAEWCEEQAETYAREARMWPESADEHYGNRDAYLATATRIRRGGGTAA